MESTFDLEYDGKGNPIADPALVDILSIPPLLFLLTILPSNIQMLPRTMRYGSRKQM
jgi:hypothetical protein